MANNTQGIKNAVYITLKIMLAFGLKDYQAVGFAGCWMCESCCNPGAYNKAEKNGTFKGSSANGEGYGAGLAQWSNSWKTRIQKQFNRYTPIETWTMDEQIDIVLKGCSSSFILMLKNCSSASESTDIILRGYENGSGGRGTLLRSQESMKAYTWCKRSYIVDVGYQTFPDGYIGALTARTAWSNKILQAMGSNAYSDLSDIGGLSFYKDYGSSNNEAYGYTSHNEYVTYSGSGGNIFSSAGENSFAQASMRDNTIGKNDTKNNHTRIYSTNDSAIVLDELRIPLDDDITYANKEANTTSE